MAQHQPMAGVYTAVAWLDLRRSADIPVSCEVFAYMSLLHLNAVVRLEHCADMPVEEESAAGYQVDFLPDVPFAQAKDGVL